MTYEVEIRIIHRNDRGKIVRIDRAWGNDPLLQRFTHWGGEPIGAEYKKAQRMRKPLPIDPLKMYLPGEVASILNCSYDTAIRRMERMKTVADIGEHPHKKPGVRRRRTLVISGQALKDFIRNRQPN